MAADVLGKARLLRIDAAQAIEWDGLQVRHRLGPARAPDIGGVRGPVRDLRWRRREAFECLGDAGEQVGVIRHIHVPSPPRRRGSRFCMTVAKKRDSRVRGNDEEGGRIFAQAASASASSA